MTSIIAVVQIAALLTTAILVGICLACGYKHSMSESNSRAQVKRLNAQEARPNQQSSIPMRRSSAPQAGAIFRETKAEAAYE
jgi:flagellar basal body L-ring protein FlgH